MDQYQAVGAPGAMNYGAPLVNFGIPGVTQNQPQPQQRPPGQPGQPGQPPGAPGQQAGGMNPNWMAMLRQYLGGQTGTSPQPVNPTNTNPATPSGAAGNPLTQGSMDDYLLRSYPQYFTGGNPVSAPGGG